MTDAFYDHLADVYIKFPTTNRQINIVKETFMNKSHFPGIIEAVDGTHIAVLKPVVEEHNFINPKGFHSINVQGICDANMKILPINANYPGSTHDAFIFSTRDICENISTRDIHKFGIICKICIIWAIEALGLLVIPGTNWNNF